MRLRALLDSPLAFLRTHEEESLRDADHWRERAAIAATSSTSSVYVALDGAGTAIGMAGGWQRDADRVVVWGVWVEPSSRGGGTGEALIAAVELWARGETTAGVLALEVAEGNDRAAQFYERLGFAPTGVRVPFREGTGLIEVELAKALPR